MRRLAVVLLSIPLCVPVAAARPFPRGDADATKLIVDEWEIDATLLDGFGTLSVIGADSVSPAGGWTNAAQVVSFLVPTSAVADRFIDPEPAVYPPDLRSAGGTAGPTLTRDPLPAVLINDNLAVPGVNGAHSFLRADGPAAGSGGLVSTRVAGSDSGARTRMGQTSTTGESAGSGAISANPGGPMASALTRPIILGAGSRTSIGTAAVHGGSITLAAGTTLEVNGGLLVNNGTITGTTNVNSGGLVKGSGRFGPVHVTAGGRVAPGNSPGAVTTGDGTSWGAGGTYQWEVNDATGGPGGPAGWDVWNVAGTLNVTAGATPNSQLTIEVTGQNAGNPPGTPDHYTSTQSYSWVIATATTDITGFDPAKFALNTSHFSAPGNFSLARAGNTIVLSFAPVPEPVCTLAVLGAGVASAAWWRRCRRTVS
jgi:hypothetical protein